MSWPIIFVRRYSILVKFKYSIYANHGDNDDNDDDDGDDGDDGNINAEQKEPATRTLGRGTLEDNPRGKLPPTWLGFCWD